MWLLEPERTAEISARPDELKVELGVLGQAPLAGSDQPVQGLGMVEVALVLGIERGIGEGAPVLGGARVDRGP